MSEQAGGAMPLTEQQAARINEAVVGLSAMQLQWMSGYAAGLAAAAQDTGPASMPRTGGAQLTILYGSQTGNGERLAEELCEQAQARGFATTCASLAEFKPAALKRVTHAVFVVSTHGDGDPPDDAELFYEYLVSGRMPQLDKLQYTVLALGDSSYANFCQTGREFDGGLADLGASRFLPLTEFDLDYDAAAWHESVIAKLPDILGSPVRHLRAVESLPAYGKDNPFTAEVLVNQQITGAGSSKDVRHVELSIEGSGIHYEPGDSLAVVPHNPPELVDELIGMLHLDAGEEVNAGGETLPLRDALSSKLEITTLCSRFLEAWASGNDELSALLPDQRMLDSHQVIDIVSRFPASVTAQQFVDSLRRLAPRSYSISSSLNANPDEVHLTVAAVRYEAFGRTHEGAASTYLCDRLPESGRVSVFVEPNRRFRLPDPDVPIIMIGPGTGIAPFRAFVEERAEQGATGKSWLFFGDRNFHSDFLYQLEWQRHLKRGHLSRMDVAFSRDQQHKVYVQDLIAKHASDVYEWIEAGAVIYVCGDAKRMAKDVDETLLDVLQQQGRQDRAAAEARLKALRQSRRYQRDVY